MRKSQPAIAGFEYGIGPRAKECRQPLEAGKRQENGFSSRTSRKERPCQNLDLYLYCTKFVQFVKTAIEDEYNTHVS